jgi:hypothetical protein
MPPLPGRCLTVGSWGVSAHESDYGLDLLAVVTDKHLREVNYKHFGIREATELLKTHIVAEFNRENGDVFKEIGSEKAQEYIDYFNEYTFPYHYAYAVMLVAECFAEYIKEGNLTVYDYGAKKDRTIFVFMYNTDELNAFLTELRAILNPEHVLYVSWKESKSFDKWKAFMEKLCGIVSQAISEGGERDA